MLLFGLPFILMSILLVLQPVTTYSIINNQSNTTKSFNSPEISVHGIQAYSMDYLNFSDNDVGFRLKYPSDWNIVTNNTQFSTVVGFKSPNNDAGLDVRVFPKNGYKSIKDYGDKTFKGSDDTTKLLQYYRNSTTLLSDRPAIKVIYLTTYNPSSLERAFGYKSSTSKAMMVATLVPEKKSIYALVYFAMSDNFYDFIPQAEQMVKSFEIYYKDSLIQEQN